MMDKTSQPEGLVPGPAGVAAGRLLAVIPLMTVVNYSVQDTFGSNVFFWAGLEWFQRVLHSERMHERALVASSCFPASSWRSRFRSASSSR